MITGFNTDIEHDGVTYHVQTEDKGLDTPIILSLVYVGGAILASKRAPYEDLIAQGFSDEVLAERLKRQHRLICAAINSGRIEDLKRMSPRVEEPSSVIAEPISTPAEPSISIEAEIVPEQAVEAEEVAAGNSGRSYRIDGRIHRQDSFGWKWNWTKGRGRRDAVKVCKMNE